MKSIICKLGNMRKAVDWVLYPQDSGKPEQVIIQCDKRIARVFLNTGKATLSDGKGGHPGFHKLSTFLGAEVVDVPDDVLDELKRLVEFEPQVGPVSISEMMS